MRWKKSQAQQTLDLMSGLEFKAFTTSVFCFCFVFLMEIITIVSYTTNT